MEQLGLLSLALGSSWTSGINLYLTVAILGLSDRFGYFDLPAGLEVLSHPLVIGVAVLLYAIEFFADKVPYVDSAWDSVHTFIRPLGGMAIGYLAFTDAGAPVQMAVSLLTGSMALESHLAKASARAAINTSPEPVTNVTASVAEDTAVVGVMYLVLQHPVIAFFVVIGLVVLSAFLLRFLFRFVKAIFSGGSKKASSSTS